MIRFGPRIRQAKVSPPVFVLGVMRSGTTHLINLFAEDKRFGYPTLIHVNNPYSFLTLEPFFAKVLDTGVPMDRGIDNMSTGSKAPEEDEYALLSMTRLSFLLAGTFPGRATYYRRFLTFRDASRKEIACWKKALKYFVQKLSLRYGGRPIVLKSPAHTARIRMILDAFPDAKFVLIHRHPFEVFRSYVQMLGKFSAQYNFASFERGEMVNNFAIAIFKEINEAFFADRDLIPKDHYCEIGYESLVKDPIGQMRSIYDSLDLPDFKVVEPTLRNYLKSIADYKKNKQVELPEKLRARLAAEWPRYFQEWGYSAEKVSETKESQR
jgi:hypothetical protein